MRATVPIDVLAHQPQIGFVDQCRCLQRMIRTLPPHVPLGQPMQFRIDQGQQTLRRLRVSRMHRLQELCHLPAVVIHGCLQQTLWYSLGQRESACWTIWVGTMADLEQSAEQLFGEALELQPERRAAFLDQACRGAPELRRLVEELLRDNQLAASFLAEPILTPDGGAAVSATQSAASLHLSAGTKLGRYSIVEPLGAGGMGVVYRARDEKLERVVAIKLLAPGMFTGDEARRRVHKEALALAKLSHAHIAAVYDVGEQDGIDYIVMECVPGESLAAKLKPGPLTVKDATSITLQIAEALEEAHEQGVIHRDLKPANVMITPKGRVKVLDFGLAKLLAVARDPTVSVTETRGLIGTPLYMSPEQAREQNLDARTDLWNLGVIYYELLTGRAPFRADSSIGVLRAITDQAPMPL